MADRPCEECGHRVTETFSNRIEPCMTVHTCYPSPWRLVQEDQEYEVSFGHTVRAYLEKKKKKSRRKPTYKKPPGLPAVYLGKLPCPLGALVSSLIKWGKMYPLSDGYEGRQGSATLRLDLAQYKFQ